MNVERFYRQQLLQGRVVIIVGHATRDTLRVIQHLHRLGAKSSVLFFISADIEYDTRHDSILLKIGTLASVCTIHGIGASTILTSRWRWNKHTNSEHKCPTVKIIRPTDYVSHIASNAKAIIVQIYAHNKDMKLSVLDNGSYIAESIFKELRGRTHQYWKKMILDTQLIMSELTERGLRILEKNQELITWKVTSIARHPVKMISEAKDSALVSMMCLQYVMNHMGVSPRNCTALVLGSSGSIGMQVVRYITSIIVDHRVHCFDNTMLANSGNIQHIPTDVNLFIGTTGNTSVHLPEFITYLNTTKQKNIWLCSTSSRSVEFQTIKDWLWKTDPGAGSILPDVRYGTLFRINGKAVYLLANGLPINFCTAGNPSETMQLVLDRYVISHLNAVYQCQHHGWSPGLQIMLTDNDIAVRTNVTSKL
jgi:hypothetical protein